ncbi:aspartic-type signal peptidase [Fusarium heterosporum]|uniref:Aspartic-type signal peptidase n=1 Tax=Fusarium heterosporum TaxID=42747 RepID=A0A8H5TUM2_FUSHE|nr:aspartic-type signal peptidase [Fusarium heterosporum]
MLSALFLAAAVPALASAFDLSTDTSPDGLIRFPLKVSTGAPVVKGVTKRQNEVALESQQNGFFYSIDVTLGTPGQQVTVNLDTGSAELWVNPDCDKAQQPSFCSGFGHFGESSTYVDLKTTGGVVYGTGYAYWNYGYDNVVVGSASIRNQVFGVAYDSSFTSVGIMGAGPDLNGWDAPYPLVIDSMVKQGLINSRVLSLDIRTLDNDRGAVIFGGIDTRKYTGRLEKRPIIPAESSPDKLTRYWVYLDGISIIQDDGSTDAIFSQTNGQPVLLDSGYTVSALPGPIFNKIVAAFPTAKTGPGAYVDVDCSVADLKGSVDFKFGNTVIKVPYADFIWRNDDRCVLGVFQDDEFPVLGDTFLRAAYVVYDWDNRNVWLANNEDCGTNLVAVGTGPNAVPDLVGECGSGSTSTSELPTSTETASVTESVTESASESMSETLTETVSSAETTGNTTISTKASQTFATYTRYSNTTFISTKYAGTTGGPAGGPGQSYVLPATTVPSTTVTATVTTSKVYTVTACPPSVTNCPVGHVTTETITHLTTYCPGSDATPSGNHGAPQPTKGPVRTVITSTRVHTITKCPGSGPCAEGGMPTTEIVYKTQLMHPEQPTGVFTIPQAIQCGAGNFGCKEGTTLGYHTFTMTSVVEAPKPTPVPGYCKNCGPPRPGNHGNGGRPSHHNNGTFTSTFTNAYTVTRVHTEHEEPTKGYAKPTKDHAEPISPQPTPNSPKPTAKSHNPIEELYTYLPTDVHAQLPSNTVATVVKTPQGESPTEPTGTPVPVVNGASAWNVPVLAAVIVGAFVAAL